MNKLLMLACVVGCQHETIPPTPVPTPVQPPPPTATCTPSQFALARDSDTTAAVKLFEVDGHCVVREIKELDFSDAASHVLDVAWPTRDALYVVIQPVKGNEPQWGRVASPLVADPTKVAWKTEPKRWAAEPEGFTFGIEPDGDAVDLAYCAKWTDGGGAEEVEEWDCLDQRFWSLAKTKRVEPPLPPFTEAISIHPFAATIGKVSLEGTKAGLVCDVDGKQENLGVPWSPTAVVRLSDDTYFLVEYEPGHRNRPNPTPKLHAMRGCAEHPTIKGEIVPGPNGLWLNGDADGTWHVRHGLDDKPLATADGKPFEDWGAVAVWTR